MEQKVTEETKVRAQEEKPMKTDEQPQRDWRWLTTAAIVAVVMACEAAVVAGQEPPPAAYPNGKLLVEPTDLKKSIDSSSVLVVDVRPPDAYRQGHLPDAVSLDIEQLTKQSRQPGALKDAKLWAELVGSVGIQPDKPVVIYDETVTPNAARAWWLLRYVGHPDVRLLNGGLVGWKASGGTLGRDEVRVTRSKFIPKFQSHMLADAETVRTVIGQSGSCLVDSRTTAEYTGQQAQGPRGGRVPGAKHLEWKEFLDARGQFKPANEIAQLLVKRKISADEPAITYCQSGGRAALDAFALELMGFKNVKNYYGSWSEWSADEKLPVEKGK
jgi:thiosulfate/3-mercaptopyruvate sulfurtransferase